LSPPDVILLDVMMPGTDGFEVASKLRVHEQTKDIPLVMVTALGEVKHRVKALESGADDFLTKPVDETELLTRVKTLVQKSERIRQLIVLKKRPLIPIISIAVAIIMAVVSTILVITNKPTTKTEAVDNLYEMGFQAGLGESSQKVERQIEYRDVVREVVKEVTVEKPIKQREFVSLEELKKWLAERSVTKNIFFFVTPDGTQASSNKYDCDDYALDLQKRALEDGYLLSTSIIEKQGQLHMINLATIGNAVYYIEPQTDEVWFYANRD